MTRYDKLLKEITKGLDMDKRSNTVFSDWTPHNVRRLIIGIDKAVVQYHITGGKFERLVHVVDYTSLVSGDYALFQNGDKSLKPLIGVLVDRRVCSAVEEIVLAYRNYPQDLIGFDFNLEKLAQGQGNSIEAIRGRFSRLNRVYVADASVDALVEMLRNDTDPCKLLFGMLKTSCKTKVIAEINKDWYKGTTKFWNSKIYLMDKEDGALYKRLKSVEAKFVECEERAKATQLGFERAQKIADRNFANLPQLYASILDMHSQVTSFLAGIGLVSKARYGAFLLPQSIARMYKKASAQAESKIARVYWKGIENIMSSGAPDLLTFLGTIHTLCNTGKLVMEQGDLVLSEQHKKDTLYSDVESCKVFGYLAWLLLDVYADSVFVALVKCLAPVKAKHAKKNYDVWALKGIEDLTFSADTSKNANLVMDENYLYDVLTSLGVQHVSAESRSKADKVRQAMVALRILQMYETMLNS